MSFLDRLAACRPPDLGDYRPFVVEGRKVGYVTPIFAKRLGDFADVFEVSGAVSLNPALTTYEARTDAVAGVLERLMDAGDVPGWRGERYPVALSFAGPAYLEIERAAVPLLGTIGYGVHLNGVVARGADLAMWIARRSLAKPTGPGKLDQIVAGGQPAGISLADNLVKECGEEAAIGEDLARGAVPVGAVTYTALRPEGLRRDVLFVYDLLLPDDFTPDNTDGEVEDFHLMAIADVAERVRESDDFKFNCALVVIHYLIRNGYIEPDHADYTELVHGLGSLT